MKRIVWVLLSLVVVLPWAGMRSVRAQEADTGRFLLLSDFHFNPFFDPNLFPALAERPGAEWAEILRGSQPAGFNRGGTDSNAALVESAIQAARAQLPRPDFILYPGDFLAHRWPSLYDALATRSHRDDPAAYQAFNRKTMEYLASQFEESFPDIPVFATLGNDDSGCGDYRLTPGGPFLAMFAACWTPFLEPWADPALNQTLLELGAYSARLPGTSNLRLVVLTSIFFSANYDNACGRSLQTPGLDQLDWLETTLDAAARRQEIVWLLMHIPPGIDAFDTMKSIANDGPVIGFWQPELTSRYLRILEAHKSIIRFAFHGHTHMDDFRLIRLDDRPTLAGKIAPSVSPIFGNNPGFQVYQYDRLNGVVENFQTYYLSNLDAASDPNHPARAAWAFEYDFREAYGLATMDPDAMTQFVSTLQTDPTARASYSRYYALSAPPGFDQNSVFGYLGAIANITPAEWRYAYQEFRTSRSRSPTPSRQRLEPVRPPR